MGQLDCVVAHQVCQAWTGQSAGVCGQEGRPNSAPPFAIPGRHDEAPLLPANAGRVTRIQYGTISGLKFRRNGRVSPKLRHARVRRLSKLQERPHLVARSAYRSAMRSGTDAIGSRVERLAAGGGWSGQSNVYRLPRRSLGDARD